MRLELYGGAYSTRSPLGSNQGCFNLFPEKPRKDGPDTWTHYQRPGLRRLVSPALSAEGRGVFRSSRGQGFCVVGQKVYSIAPNWTMTQIGTLAIPGFVRCGYSDNGTTAMLVDGSNFGYSFAIADGSGFAPIADNTGTFEGSIAAAYLDTFLLWPLPNSNLFGSTYSNVLTFDPTWVAGKTGFPDLLQTLFVNRHEILLLGQVRSEIWYDAGGALFPFALLPGAYIEWGVLAPRSPASADVNVYWLAQGESGTGLVIRQRGYETRVISNYAISYAIGQMLRNGADISDAVGSTYTRDGHVFYELTFQSGDQTWVFDESVGDPELAWHQRGFSDANGQRHRVRGISYAWLNNTNVCQDWQNGTLYSVDPDFYFDEVDAGDGQGSFARPLSFSRTFPQIKMADGGPGQPPVMLDGLSLTIHEFRLDFDCGNADPNAFLNSAHVGLRTSWNRGRSYNNFVLQSTGSLGEFAAAPKWGNLGQGRWPVLEVNYSIPGPAALNGGFIRATVRTN